MGRGRNTPVFVLSQPQISAIRVQHVCVLVVNQPLVGLEGLFVALEGLDWKSGRIQVRNNFPSVNRAHSFARIVESPDQKQLAIPSARPRAAAHR